MTIQKRLWALAFILASLCSTSGRADTDAAYQSKLSTSSFPRLLLTRAQYLAQAANTCGKNAVEMLTLAAVESVADLPSCIQAKPVAHPATQKKAAETFKNESSACRVSFKKMQLAHKEIQLRLSKAQTSFLKTVENIDPKQLRADTALTREVAGEGRSSAQ